MDSCNTHHLTYNIFWSDLFLQGSATRLFRQRTLAPECTFLTRWIFLCIYPKAKPDHTRVGDAHQQRTGHQQETDQHRRSERQTCHHATTNQHSQNNFEQCRRHQRAHESLTTEQKSKSSRNIRAHGAALNLDEPRKSLWNIPQINTQNPSIRILQNMRARV